MLTVPPPIVTLLATAGAYQHGEINAMLSSLQPIGGVLYLRGGRFKKGDSQLITIPDGVTLRGEGYGTVIDATEETGTDDLISLGTRSALENLKIEGSISVLRNIGNRIAAGDYSRIQNVWIDKNAYGIDLDDTDGASVLNCRATDIRGAQGYAAALHFGDTDKLGRKTTHALVRGIYIDGADRGIEVEDGTSYCVIEYGHLKNCYAGTGANYSFVLDAHSHTLASGGAAVHNITYRDIVVESCDPCGAQGVTDNRVHDVLYENVHVVTPRVNASGHHAWNCFYADRLTLRDCSVRGETGALSMYFANLNDLTWERLNIRDHSSLTVSFDTTNGVRSSGGVWQQGSGGTPVSGYSFASGTNVVFADLTIRDLRGSTNGVLLSSSQSRDWYWRNCELIADATNPCGRWFNLNGTNINLLNNPLRGSPTTQGVDVQSVTGGLISGNYIENRGILIRSGAVVDVRNDNIIASGTIVNQSTSARVQSLLTLRAVAVAIGTSGSPADRASITLPAWVTKYQVEKIVPRAVTAAGTLAAASVDLRTAAAGGGASLLSGGAAALTGLTAADTIQSLTPAAATSVQTASTLYIRQTNDSANAGTIDLEIDIRVLA